MLNQNIKFQQTSCKLKLVLKDQETLDPKCLFKQKSVFYEAQPTAIKWQNSSPLKEVAQQFLRLLETKQAKTSDSKGFAYMMERLVTDFKAKKSKQKSIKRAQSCKKASQKSFSQSKKQTIFEVNTQISSKTQIVKKLKLQSPSLLLTGRKAEQLQSRKRPQSSYDLNVRTSPQKRPTTSKSIRRQHSNQMSSVNSINSLSKRSNISSFSFKDYEGDYMKKLKLFLDFLFKVNYSNKVYIQFLLKPVQEKITRYRIFVGNGNNSKLVKQLLRRRFWYEITNHQQQCHFYWTQHTLKKQHSQQMSIRYQQQSRQQYQKISNSLNQQASCRSPKFKVESQEQVIKLNNKFLKRQQSDKVEEFITKEGYIAFRQPFKFITLTNHISGTSCMTSKKALLKNIKNYYEEVLEEDPFTIIPKSFHIDSLSNSQTDFYLHVFSLQPKKLWIIKPSENSCRGQGIQILPAAQVIKRIKERWDDEQQTCTFIVQSYIQNPLLYNQRKFDLRHYMLLTCINGSIKAYWYREGYVRTSSDSFHLVTKIKCRNPLAKKFKNQFAQQQSTWLKKKALHITNDCVQAESKDYGKYEPGNKLSYNDLQKYFDYSFAEYPFFGKIIPKMKQIAKKVLQSVKGQIDPERKSCNFQLFGLDYILDEDFNVWLLQINNNPCYQNNSPVLDRVIPSLLQQTFRFCVDPLLPPQNHFSANQRHFLLSHSLAGLKFELFYEEE